MTYRRFIWRNALRNKRRTGLTIVSIGFSLFLLMAMLTFMDALLNPVMMDESALRLVVSRSTALTDMMPAAYRDKIERVPGVEYVSPLQWFNGVYQDPKYLFPTFATDPRTIWDIYTEQKVSPETRAAFIAERIGAVVGTDLVKRFGWRVGDRITLLGTIFPVDLELHIVGIYDDPTYKNMLYFRYDYLDEAMGKMGQVGSFAVKCTDAASVPVVAEKIDAMFRNSPAETKTQTEKAFVLGFMSMLGNIQVIIGSVAGVVVFTMLLVCVSTMAMTVRERIREVAILKTIGFSRQRVLSLVVAEATFISMAGAGLGLALGGLLRLVDMERITQGFIMKFDPGLPTYAGVIGTGLAIGLISGLIPAWQAANMTITGAMRRME